MDTISAEFLHLKKTAVVQLLIDFQPRRVVVDRIFVLPGRYL